MKNDMKKLIIMIIILTACLIILWLYSMNRIVDLFDKANEPVGKEMVIKGDTLLIMDYKFLGNSYLLEDGREVGESFVREYFKDTMDGDQ